MEMNYNCGRSGASSMSSTSSDDLQSSLASPRCTNGVLPSTFGFDAFGSNQGTSTTEMCQLCSLIEATTTLMGVKICDKCKRFISRHTRGEAFHLNPEAIGKLTCRSGSHVSLSCDLQQKNPCTKCRLMKFAELTLNVRRLTATLSPDDPFNSQLEQIVSLRSVQVSQQRRDLFQRLSERVNRRNEQAAREINKPALSQSQSWAHDPYMPSIELETDLPIERNHPTGSVQYCNFNVILREKEYAEVKPEMTLENLIPIAQNIDENSLWRLVGDCIYKLTHWELPVIEQLAGGLRTMSHIDMCRLVESSYALMFYAETGLPNRTNVAISFASLFKGMANTWPELNNLMAHTHEIVLTIKQWSPTKEEFAILLARIICNSVVKNSVHPSTYASLKFIDYNVTCHADEMLLQSHPLNGYERIEKINILLGKIKNLRNQRRLALKQFYRSDSERCLGTVYPVIAAVCEYFRETWQYDYFTQASTTAYDLMQPYSTIPRNGVRDIAVQVLEEIVNGD